MGSVVQEVLENILDMDLAMFLFCSEIIFI